MDISIKGQHLKCKKTAKIVLENVLSFEIVMFLQHAL